MNEFLSKLSGQIAGPIILGTFFPVLLFFAVFSLVVLPITPYGHQFTNLVRDPYHWQANGVFALTATFIILVLTVVLNQLNNPLIRLYEGYPWEDSWIGQRKTKWNQSHFDLACEMKRRTEALAREVQLEGIEVDPGWLTDVPQLAGDLIDKEYPNERDLILPTRMGNVIRAFETYTQRRYGASSIALWSRLQGVMEPSYATALENSKTAFDFMLNCSFLSTVLGLLLVAAGFYWQHPKYHGLLQGWEAWAIGCFGVSYLLYLGAINSAAEWGVGIKAAFDLYRLALLTKLGYETKPANLAEERRMWDTISYHFAFPSDDTYPELPYRVPSTSLIVDPVSAIVTLRRTVSVLDNDITQIRAVVSNTDPSATNVDEVVLREEIPANTAFVKNSASVDGATAVLLSTEPLVIRVGPLPFSQSRTVVYQLKKQVAK